MSFVAHASYIGIDVGNWLINSLWTPARVTGLLACARRGTLAVRASVAHLQATGIDPPATVHHVARRTTWPVKDLEHVATSLRAVRHLDASFRRVQSTVLKNPPDIDPDF
jgi:hypothetical protein